MLERLKQTQLPIVEHLERLGDLISKHTNLVLKADPGAGKTTLVPLALLNQIASSQKILMLEPRRLAARNAAMRMAELVGENVGETIGFRIRNEVKVSSKTRIEVITEGILTRMLQNDPELTQVGLIIFDEFHERSLDADIGLAFAIEVQQTLRDDLKLLVMSATLETSPIAKLLNGAEQLTSEGRSYPVSIHYAAPKFNAEWWSVLPKVINENLSCSNALETGEDILVFLPGVAEIKRAEKLLQPLLDTAPVEIVSLYGDLPFQQQRKALLPIAGKQKIILSTNIAETSVTIEGVSCVIDCGLMRLSAFDPNVGFNRLYTRRISQASAIQRAGRAGRLAAGKCYRLWAESESLRAETTPEICRADLAAFALELAQWGIHNPQDLNLLDQPNAGMLAQAKSLLQSLDALEQQAKITQHGKRLLALGIHPRIGHMLLTAISRGVAEYACLLAALLEEKDPLTGEQQFDVDFMTRVELLLSNSQNFTLKQIRKQATNLYKKIQSQPEFKHYPQHSIEESVASTAELLAMAFPDRIAQKRGAGYRLANGSGAILAENASLATEYLVVVRLGGQGSTAKIFQAVALDKNQLESFFIEKIQTTENVYWDEKSQSVKGESERKLGELILSTRPLKIIDEVQRLNALLGAIKNYGAEKLPWTEPLRQWRTRVVLLAQLPEYHTQFPDLTDQYLLDSLQSWLAPFLSGAYQLSQFTSQVFTQALHSLLDWPLQQLLEQLAPVKIRVASGSEISIDYCQGNKPVLAVKLQEMFGETQTPSIADGRIPVVLHLLSPARRPLQITEDLASFWANSYQQVKKEMKGRYPKHPWPDDPVNAVATRLTKKRLTHLNT